MATIVEWDPNVSFSIATIPKRRKGALLHSLDCSTLPLIRILYCWVLSKEISNTISWVFGMTRPWIELRSLRPFANTIYIYIYIIFEFEQMSSSFRTFLSIHCLQCSSMNCIHSSSYSSKSNSFCINTLVILPSAPITIFITVT